MKRSGLAIAVLAVACVLTFAMVFGQLRQAPASVRGATGSTAPAGVPQAAANPRTSAGAGLAAPAIVRLPHSPGPGPVPLQLTVATLEQAWQRGALTVHPGRGAPWRIAIEDRRPEPGGLWTLVGRVQTRFGPQAMVMTFGPGGIFGVLPQPDGSQLQVTTSAGTTRIAPAGGMLPPGETPSTALPDYVVPGKRGTAAAARARRASQLADPRPSKSAPPIDITVLGVYTPDLVALYGSEAAAEAQYVNLLAIANQAHVDSGSQVRLQLVGLQLAAVNPDLNNYKALYAVTDNRVTGTDLHQLRDTLEADLVAVLRSYQQSFGNCGVAWLNGGGRAPDAITDAYGFSVSNAEPCGPHVLAHEIGHNLGSAHELAMQTGFQGKIDYGVYDYSFGHATLDPPYSTIMAYGVGGHVTVFSSPALDLCGGPCGTEDEADNVRSLNNAAPATAAFRGPPVPVERRTGGPLPPRRR